MTTVELALVPELATEPTRPLICQLPAHRDPLWSLGHEVAELVIDYVLDADQETSR